jgi:hypothetical protein
VQVASWSSRGHERGSRRRHGDDLLEPGCHDDVARAHRAGGCVDAQPARVPGDRGGASVLGDRQPVQIPEGHERIGELGGRVEAVRVGTARGRTREARHGACGVQPEGAPAVLPPGLADPALLDDDVLEPALQQRPAGGQPGVAGSDHDGLDVHARAYAESRSARYRSAIG